MRTLVSSTREPKGGVGHICLFCGSLNSVQCGCIRAQEFDELQHQHIRTQRGLWRAEAVANETMRHLEQEGLKMLAASLAAQATKDGVPFWEQVCGLV